MASEQVNVNGLKKGFVLELPEGLMQVLESAHHKPGKGNAVVRTKLRRLSDGNVLDRTFNSDTKVGMIRLERREMQYLYPDGDSYVFMDNESFEQIGLTAGQLGEETVKFLKEGTNVEIAMHEANPIMVEMPTSVDLVVTETDPGNRGDRANAGTKPAKLETGTTILLPLFVQTGDIVRVDTRTGEYVTRVQQ